MIHTTKLWKNPPIGFVENDDAVVFISEGNDRFVFLGGEFNVLGYGLYDVYWKRKRINYIQILKEWNECRGYHSVEGIKSKILDLDSTLDAFQQLQELMIDEKGYLENLDNNNDFYCPDYEDIGYFIEFLEKQISIKSVIYITEGWRGDALTNDNAGRKQ